MFFLALAVLPFAADLLTGLLMSRREISTTKLRYPIALSAGMVTAAAFFELLPEVNVQANMPIVVLGFFAFYLVEKATLLHSCGEGECEVHSIGRFTAIGMALDNILDGLGIAIAYAIEPFLGLVVTIVVLVHEIPQAIASLSLLKRDNRSVREQLSILIIAGLLYPLGALLSLVFPEELYEPILAVVAGVFLYVGTGDLLSEAHKRFNWKVVALVVLGALIAFSLSLIEPH